ncbi:hypothetical protein A3A46_00995 [Candidatus Roizmanbacteria bacterium RIFCSPLOWO2_01_FULL_37_13]|nr:MAG: hypothetical protein A3A46_00995 [Candidatus Roizmanbacteria bacterium RIFCSPLOWO2_01_FULL_37_13]
MNFIRNQRGFSPILVFVISTILVFTVANLVNKTKTQLTTKAASCVTVASVAPSKTSVDIGECFDCVVTVASGQGGGPNIACGLAVNNSWPQNICPSSVAYNGCQGFKGWSGDVATFGCQMPTVTTTDTLEMVGFDFQTTCGPANGQRTPITLRGNTPAPPTLTPTPNPNCPAGKVDQTGQCNTACCSNNAECNDPHVPGQQNQVCTISNGYCNSGYSCSSPTAPTNTPIPPNTPTPGGPALTRTPTPGAIATRTPTPGGPAATNTPTPIPTTPPSGGCKLGQETYQLGESYCDETNNSVKRCEWTGQGQNGQWKLQIPDPCPGKPCSNDPAKHSFSCINSCQPLVGNLGDTNKLKIAFLPENYSTFSEFLPVARDAIDEINKTNLAGLTSKMNFYIVADFSQTYHDDPSKPYEGIQFPKIKDIGAQVCGADSSIVIDNPAKCGAGNVGKAVLGRSSYACGAGATTVPHELAHAIVWLEDEYGDSNSPVGPLLIPLFNCSGPGSGPLDPFKPCPKWTGMTGVGCYQGCGPGTGYSGWYRPTQTSIMRDRNYIFNPPSLKAWEDFLQNYQ